MKWMLWVVVAAVALYGLHRFALWAEQRGWIYYLKKRGSSDAIGNAMLELQKIAEPSREHVLKERRKDDSEAEESGDPPSTKEGN